MFTAKLILERINREGTLAERREQQSRSFVMNFIKLLYVAHAQITAGAPYPMQDITDAARNIDSATEGAGNYRGAKCNLRIGSPGGLSGAWCWSGANPASFVNIIKPSANVGIVVGSGVGAVVPTNYALGTKIAHGDGAGELEYGGCELIGLTLADPNGQFTIRRYLTNSSGGNVTVQEVGIYSPGGDGTLDSSFVFAIARDITGAVVVADTELLRVTYAIQITV